jgi:hypothetical protein
VPDPPSLGGGVDADVGRGWLARKVRGEGRRLGVRFGLAPAAKFGEQEATPGRKEGDVVEGLLLGAKGVKELAVDAFEADERVLKQQRNLVGGEEDVGEPDAEQGAEGRALDQAQRGGEDHDASSFAADERSRWVEAGLILGQEFVEIEAGDASRDLGETGADLVGVAVADGLEAGVDLADASSGGDVGFEFGVGGWADSETGSVVEEQVERDDIVDRLASHQGVDAAGVVADHAAEGAAGVGCGVGGEGEVVELGSVAETVEHDAGLHLDRALDGVDGRHAVHVFGEVEDDRGVAALPGERRSGPAGEEGGVELAAEVDGGDDVGFVAGDDEADGNLAVVGRVGGVEGAGGGIEADFAADDALQSLL